MWKEDSHVEYQQEKNFNIHKNVQPLYEKNF